MNDKTFNETNEKFQIKVVNYWIDYDLMLRQSIPQPEKFTPNVPQFK